MANSFKTLTEDDKAITRTLLHEAIPIPGSIVAGTYAKKSEGGTKSNIKSYSHGLFESTYDFPFLSSSANHLFDITAGYSADSGLSSPTNEQNADKINMYTEMAHTLVPNDINGNVQNFDEDGNITGGGTKIKEAFFINFARSLTKDEIKKGSFGFDVYQAGTLASISNLSHINDSGNQNDYRVNSPAGEFGTLQSGSTNVGLIYYQAGIAVLTASIFEQEFGTPDHTYTTDSVDDAFLNGTIDELAEGLRYRIEDIDYNNSVELNSSIYFCRAKNNEFNYSANPTYTSGSQIVVKNDNSDLPVSYITTVGLYSPDNELWAAAKLSEPVRKDPSNELNVKVRIDY